MDLAFRDIIERFETDEGVGLVRVCLAAAEKIQGLLARLFILRNLEKVEDIIEEVLRLEADESLQLWHVILLGLLHGLEPHLNAFLSSGFIGQVTHGADGKEHLLKVGPVADVALDFEIGLLLLEESNEEVVSCVVLAVVYNLADLAVGDHDLALEFL